MHFKRTVKNIKLLVPPDFKSDIQEIEYREDPLTGSICILNARRAQRAKQARKAAIIAEDVAERMRGFF